MKLSVLSVALTFAIMWGGVVLMCGIANAIWPSYGVAFLDLLASIYPGYHVGQGFGSVVFGTGYAVLDGAVGGLVFAWLYNRFAACGHCCER